MLQNPYVTPLKKEQKMNLKIYITLIAATAVSAGSACIKAATPAGFDEIVAEVIAGNPALGAERARMAAELGAEAAENIPSDPEVSFEYLWGVGKLADGNKWNAGISQSFDWPGVYSARRKATARRATAFSLLYRDRMADAVRDARTALIDIIGCRRRLELCRRQSATLDSLLESSRNAFERGGAITILDYKKLQIESNKMRVLCDDTEAELDALRASLIAMGGNRLIDTESLLNYPAMPLLTEAEYLDILDTQDPYVLSRAPMLDAGRERLSAARRSRLPGFTIGYSFENEAGEHFTGFSAAITLPVWSRRRSITAADMELQATADEYTSAYLARRASIISDRAAAAALDRRLEGYIAALGDGSYPALLRKALDGGAMSMLDYLREMNFYTESCLEFESLLQRRARLLAILNRFHNIEAFESFNFEKNTK